MKKKRNIWRRITFILLSTILILTVVAYIYLQMPVFGQSPTGNRLERIKQSPHYREGKFQNDIPTPTFAEGYTFWNEARKSMFNQWPEQKPEGDIPSMKTDLKNLSIKDDVVIWFGHASCFIQINGKRILVDPIFNDHASPVPGSVKAFEGTTRYSSEDMPPIDYLLISHDHYDHLDYKTAVALKGKVRKVICGLGVGSHFERWGYYDQQIVEKDWREKEDVDSTFAIYVLPARHKSGRGLRQNNTLWVSFLIKTPNRSVFISGDGGYDKHFSEIGDEFGPIDLAIMECGQYDSAWRYVHLLPEESRKAAVNLKAKSMLPIHHSKFVLARHRWYEPLQKVTEENKYNDGMAVLTPMIGQPVIFGDSLQIRADWWKTISKE